jgi:hypothetical protein
MDSSTCIMSYHLKVIRDGSTVAETLRGFNFRDIQDLVVRSAEQDQKERDAASGHLTLSYRFDPPECVLVARKFGNNENSFLFYSAAAGAKTGSDFYEPR